MHDCGGALIAPTWVLTAAHCVPEGGAPQQARLGSLNRAKGGELISVAEIVVNPAFDPDTLHNDIALIKLQRPATGQPITLGATVGTGQPVRLMGWGNTCADCDRPQMSETLRELDTTVADRRRCAAGGIDARTEICVDPRGTAQASKGDSGDLW